jgi:hypothetical protein
MKEKVLIILIAVMTSQEETLKIEMKVIKDRMMVGTIEIMTIIEIMIIIELKIITEIMIIDQETMMDIDLTIKIIEPFKKIEIIETQNNLFKDPNM